MDREDGLREDSNRALERALVRERGLLLSSGVYEIEPNFIYSHASSGTLRRDSYGPGIALRAGLPWGSQLDASLPYVVERRQTGAATTNSSGVGDFSIGLSHQLLTEQGARPSLIGSLSYQAATGKNTVFESGTPVAHGTGFNSIQASLTAVKRVDPLVYFGSYTFGHSFSRRKAGVEVDPGNSHGIRFGAALATSPETSLRAAYNLTFFDKTRYGGAELAGTDTPYGLLEFGGSTVLTDSMALDVVVGAGLTRSAPDFRITVALPIRF
jgi:hypothetical protein